MRTRDDTPRLLSLSAPAAATTTLFTVIWCSLLLFSLFLVSYPPAPYLTFYLHQTTQQTSGQWVRVSYHGREDGWILTANKRGPMLAPAEGGPAAGAAAHAAQEANFAEQAAAAAAAAEPSGDDRPLTGAKPAASNAAGEQRLAGGGGGGVDEVPLGGGKGAWVPPSEFPPGHEAALAAGGGDEERAGGDSVEAGSGGGQPEYMTALGLELFEVWKGVLGVD